MSEFRVSNFEQGMTDDYVNGPENSGELFDNLLITRNRKIITRPGSELYDSDLDVLPTGNNRIQYIKMFEDFLFEFSADEIYYRDTTFKELVGPVDSHDAFGDLGSASTSHNTTAEWQSQLFAATDTYCRPRKIYKDENDVIQLRNVSLPSIGDVRRFQTCVTLANSLKTTYNAHVADLAEHLSASSAIASPNATDYDSLFTLVNELREKYTAHELDARQTTPVYHQAQITTPDKLPTLDPVVTMPQVQNSLNDLLSFYNLHDARTTAHTTGSLHQSSATASTNLFTVTPEFNSSKTYIYSLVYKYSYYVGNVQYIDRSEPTEVLVSSAGDFSTAAKGNDITNIPVLTNTIFGTKECWDTDNIKVEVYRSTDGGVTLFLNEEIPNGDTTFEDDKTDALIGFNEIIYTDSGALPNEQIPECKYVVQANDVLWYLDVKEDSEERAYRVRHSHQFIPGGSPSSYRVDLDDNITGGGAVGINPIIFTKNKTYRLEGVVDRLGRGFVKKRIIDDTVGCVSANSIISIQSGLYFASLDGFYFTDGFRVTKITDHLNKTYLNLVASESQQKRIYGAYDPLNNLVFWAAQSDSANSENDIIYVHDTAWPLRNGSEGTFTTWSYGDNGKPTALEVIDGNLIRSDSRGYTFIHNDSLYVDPIVEVSVDTSLWNSKAVIYDYISSAFSFQSELQRKWVTRLLTVLKSDTNVNVLPLSINDDSGASRELKAIRTSSVFEWGDPNFEWGDMDFVWNAPSTITAIRHFPRLGLRCTFKQVEYTNAYTIITNSDDLGDVTGDNTLNTLTLSSGDFPPNISNFEIFLNGSDSGYSIISQATGVITVQDTDDDLPETPVSSWIIKGFKHGERFHLDSYTIVYNYHGESNRPYRSGDGGELSA